MNDNIKVYFDGDFIQQIESYDHLDSVIYQLESEFEAELDIDESGLENEGGNVVGSVFISEV